MLNQSTTRRIVRAAVLLGIVASGCSEGREAPEGTAVCGSGQLECAGSAAETSDGEAGATSDVPDADGSDEASDASGEPPPPDSTTGASGRPDNDSADVPDGDPSTTTSGTPDSGGPRGCGEAFDQCLEDGGDIFRCGPLFESCSDTTGSDTAGPPEESCCDLIDESCAATPSARCGGLTDVCESGSCEQLESICPPDVIPVSGRCAFAYLQCYPGFQINNCVRIPFDTCMLHVDDLEFCTLRDEVCADRIEYCAELVGASGAEYLYCAEHGQYFDACWTSLGCDTGAASCTSAALLECSNPTQGLCAPAF